MKKIFKYLLFFILAVIFSFTLFLVYSTINDYKPDKIIQIFKTEEPDLLDETSEFSLLIWNIGYCGLNKEMDIFYDGGKNVRPTGEKIIENLNGVKSFLNQKNQTDFILLQEVDKESKRSYRINEYDSVQKLFPEYFCSYGKNYDVFFVPTPPSEPMGKVDGGLMTLSKYLPSESVRYAFPGNYDWPISIFILDPCFLVNRYSLKNEKEFIVVNTHNSAYDDERLKKEQTEYLKQFLLDEHKNGNYIIVGGDWNQCPPNCTEHFKTDKPDNEIRTNIPSDFLENWKWMYDNSLPTNRSVKTPYVKGKTPTSVIDFFLLSPNIEAISIKTVDLGFEFSDHQPVEAVIKLK